MPRLSTALAAAALLLTAGTGSAQGPFAGVMAAVDTCLAATGLNAIDPARAVRDGWTEQAIANSENAPDHPRLFSKDRSGALMLFTQGSDGAPSCHVMVVSTPEGNEALAAALVAHAGNEFLPDQGLGADISVMRVPGNTSLLVLRRRADDTHFMADVVIVPSAPEPAP
jgi:hypothetical protein